MGSFIRYNVFASVALNGSDLPFIRSALAKKWHLRIIIAIIIVQNGKYIMEYPILLETDDEKIECGEACDRIESFMVDKGEKLTTDSFVQFMNSIKYSSRKVEQATLQEVYKELARIGLCLNLNMEGEVRYEISQKMVSSMWIIMHVKLMTEYIRAKGQSDLLDYVASWLKIVSEGQAISFSDVEKYI